MISGHRPLRRLRQRVAMVTRCPLLHGHQRGVAVVAGEVGNASLQTVVDVLGPHGSSHLVEGGPAGGSGAWSRLVLVDYGRQFCRAHSSVVHAARLFRLPREEWSEDWGKRFLPRDMDSKL